MTSPLLVLTDLDACLLDAATYSYDAARPALTALAERRVPLVLCSSKTLREMEPLVRSLRLSAPFVVENGGALVIPRGHFSRTIPGAREQEGWLVLALGVPRSRLVRALKDIASETGTRIQGFAHLDEAELSRLTGLPPAAATLALQREYDEPFRLEGNGQVLEAVSRAAEVRGLRVGQGGRFFHLTGATDKGRAAHVLLGLYEAEGKPHTTVALGDAPSDLPLLRAVDRPILVPRPEGHLDETLAAALPAGERAPQPGPSGWNEAVLAVLEGRRLPPVEPASAEAR